MFEDGWRITRDWFYDPAMHGLDWAAMKKRYGALVPWVAQRSDLDFVFGEMLGELDSGHTYVSSGDEPEVPRIQGGMLGCELEADPSGRYRIAKIYAGENWDPAFRSPLTEPGIGVREGSFLLAIEGHAVRTTDKTPTASSRTPPTSRCGSKSRTRPPVRPARSRCGRWRAS